MPHWSLHNMVTFLSHTRMRPARAYWKIGLDLSFGGGQVPPTWQFAIGSVRKEERQFPATRPPMGGPMVAALRARGMDAWR